MRIDFKRRSLLVRLAALALLAFFFIQANVHATQPINSSAAQAVVFVGGWGASVGLARGQTLRVNVSNENEPGARSGSEPVFALATLYDARGNTLAQSAEVAMRAGEFRALDFDRDDLHLTGEPGTGRVQVRATALWGVRTRHYFGPDDIPASLEIVDNGTGRTAAAISSKPKEIVVVGS